MALVFAACSNDTTDNTSTNPTGSVGGGKTPLTITVMQGPTADYGWEGQTVNLTGMKLLVQYSDNTTRVVENMSGVSISPKYYWSGDTYYTIYYSENGGQARGYLDNPVTSISTSHKDVTRSYVIPLIEVVHTGTLNKSSYRVDEVPSLAGITVEGVYGTDTALPPGDGNPGTGVDHYQLPLPVNTADYEWRWVFNTDQTINGVGFTNDDAGILLKVGQYGNFTNIKALKGHPVRVTSLDQVKSIAIDEGFTFSRNIFFDDPSIIGAGNQDAWQEVLGGANITVTYDSGATRTVSAIDLYLQGSMIPGLWAQDENGSLNVNLLNDDEEPISHLLPRITTQSNTMTPDSLDTPATAAQWVTWSLYREPMIQFDYRGRKANLLVPVYNRLDSVSAAVRDGSESVIMDGMSEVYHRPDALDEFIAKVKVTAVYSKTSARTDTAVRDDVGADFARGTLKGTWNGGTSGTSADYSAFVTPTGSTNIPTLATLAPTLDGIVGTKTGSGALTERNCESYAKNQRPISITIKYDATPIDYKYTGPTPTGTGRVTANTRAKVPMAPMNYM